MVDPPPIWDPNELQPPLYVPNGPAALDAAARERFRLEDLRLTNGRRASWTAKELRQAEFPPARFVVDGLIPEGLTILAGKPKLGKSVLVLQVAIAVARGEKVLGSRRTDPGSVLYLGLEDPPRRLATRLNELTRNDDSLEHLHVETAWPLLTRSGIEKLEQWLEAQATARLVVIDTWQKVREPLRGKDRYGEEYQAAAPLQELATRYGVALLLCHHVRKADSLDWIDGVSGSTAITAAADTVLVLYSERGRHDATLRATGRDLEQDEEIALHFDRERRTGWTELGPAVDYRMAIGRKTVLDLAQEVGEIDAKAVSEALGIGPDAARKRLSRMARAGELEPTRRGSYMTPAQVVTKVTQPERREAEIYERDFVTVVTPIERVPSGRVGRFV